MGLVERLYAEDVNVNKVLLRNPFNILSPNLRFLKKRLVKRAINEGDREFFVNSARFSFIPNRNDRDVQEIYRRAMNRGIKTLNDLCEKHLEEDSEPFLIEEVLLH